MRLLGIETSCDETAVAIVDDQRRIRANVLRSQTAEHQPYGGVVPELASRAHILFIEELVHEALSKAGMQWPEIDGIAVTGGPGLIGGVMVGVMVAKGMASALGKPLIAVNHLEGHALTARLTHNVTFPFLLLLVSGGHCQLLVVEDVGRYHYLGGTLDDALGEAFDKTAKMLGLGYPGGPAVEKHARDGNPDRFDLPRPLLDRPGYDVSFSGLKTAVFRAVSSLPQPLSGADINDMCASFQVAAGDILEDRVSRAMQQCRTQYPEVRHVVIAGGVAANQYLGGRLKNKVAGAGMECVTPPIALCTDNAAMIAWAGIERLSRGMVDTLDFAPRARWPLQEETAL